jgi:small subunit ribosomal protein S2
MANVIDKIKDKLEDGIEAVEELVEKVEDKITGKDTHKDTSKKESKKKTSKTKDIETADAKSAESESSEDAATELEDKRSEIIQKTSAEIIERKKALLEKVAKLKGKVDVSPDTEELKAQVKAKKRSDMLIPLEEYVKAGIYLGTRAVTPDMKKYVYRRRADGLAIFNTDIIDEKLKEGIAYLSKFEPEDVVLVCKRQGGWKAVEKFSELTGIRAFAKKYPAGVLTNTTLPDFFENELTIVADQWLDKNALNDTLKVHKKVLMICDTNNFAKGADQVIIGNNKSPKSLGVIFYLLARGYMKAKGMDTTKVPDLEWWTEDIVEKGAKKGV